MEINHHYYYNPSKLDLSVLRADAMDRANGKGKHHRFPESSIIHMHTKYATEEQPAELIPCGTFGCETYPVKKDG